MDPLLEEILKNRRIKAIAIHQQSEADDRSQADLRIGRIAGRSVTTKSPIASKEARIFDSHVLSTVQDRLLAGSVNSVKPLNQDFMHPGLLTRIRV